MGLLIDQYGLDTLFDPIVISAAVGKLKDEAELFEKALALSNLKPEECVFIDNQQKNLLVPAALGLKTCFFDTRQNDIPRLRSQLAEWGIQIP